jgi:hypothetical protein
LGNAKILLVGLGVFAVGVAMMVLPFMVLTNPGPFRYVLLAGVVLAAVGVSIVALAQWGARFPHSAEGSASDRQDDRYSGD